MASVESVTSAAWKLWPKAANIGVHQSASRHISFSGPDPYGLQLLASDSAGNVIGRIEANDTDGLFDKLRQRLME
jgi:hypothetical protein